MVNIDGKNETLVSFAIFTRRFRLNLALIFFFVIASLL
jgi:hypothetical protein